MPLPLTVSYLSEIQIGFTFLVLARLCSLGQRAIRWVLLFVNIILSRYDAGTGEAR